MESVLLYTLRTLVANLRRLQYLAEVRLEPASFPAGIGGGINSSSAILAAAGGESVRSNPIPDVTQAVILNIMLRLCN